MLAANEFTVGTLANAEPLSLILPRTEYEETALVGHTSDGPAVGVVPSIGFRAWEIRIGRG
jgi:hypothetical protein